MPFNMTSPAEKDSVKPSNFLRQIIERDLDQGTYAQRHWAGHPADAAQHHAGQAEVQADALGVADVQVAVGLGREAGADRGMAAGRQVLADDLADEVRPDGGAPGGSRVVGRRHGIGWAGHGAGDGSVEEPKCSRRHVPAPGAGPWHGNC